MVGNLTVVIPFYNGHPYINKLIASIPKNIPILIIDDHSDEPLHNQWGDYRRVTVVRPSFKGYFTGAVNYGIGAVETDVLVLNQDTYFTNYDAFELLDDRRNEGFAVIGERIRGDHPTFGTFGYIHGTFMFLRRDAIEAVGFLNEKDYPLWGSTAEWSLRAARKGFQILPLVEVPGFVHERPETERYGSSIGPLLDSMPTAEKFKFVRTPPILSVIVPCYKYGRYVSDCVNSLIGGNTSLGLMPGQTLQSFEIIIVDDASPDDSWSYIQRVVSEPKGIRAYRLEKNLGTAGALNFGISKAIGQYITFLSADDMREPDSLEYLVEACRKNPHSFAYDDIILFARDRRVKEWRMGEYEFEDILYKNNVHTGIVYPRAAWEDVGGYPEIMRDGREDWAFNVALGVRGWCGVHVHKAGYLYRREHQNRSLSNTSPFHHERFLKKISGLFPDIYGGYRPTMCCGKKNTTKAAAQRQLAMSRTVTINSLTGGSTVMASPSGDMVEIVYTGKQQPSVWDGTITNTRYRFGIGKERGWVYRQDAGERGKPGDRGFLNVKNTQGGYVFELAEAPVAETARKAPVKATAMPKATVIVSDPEAPQEDLTLINPPKVEGDEVIVAKETEEAPAKKETGVDPSEYTVSEIMAMSLSTDELKQIYSKELASKTPRKSLITWLEEKLAGG